MKHFLYPPAGMTVLLSVCGVAFGHTPVEFMEVFSVEPSDVIEHSVELQDAFDRDRVETELSGPRFFARAVGCLQRPVRKTKAYVNWFEIPRPENPEQRTLVVMDYVQGAERQQFTIESASYLLSPAQLLTSGTPGPVPRGLDHYKAWSIIGAAAVTRDVQLTESTSSETRRILKPVFLCLAVQEWHHEEHFTVSHPRDCFVVYELNPCEVSDQVSTIDQFGLNQLQLRRSEWLCVRAKLLADTLP